MRWPSVLIWAAAVDAGLFAAIGLRHVDREAIAFGVLYAAGLVLLRIGRRGLIGVILIALLSLDTAFWMVTATISNLQNSETVFAILQPLVLAIVTAIALVAAIATLFARDERNRERLPAVAAAALAVFVVGFGAESLLNSNSLQPRSGTLELTIHNAAYSTTALNASSGPVSVSLANQDLFWHTFTIDKLSVNVLIPVGGHRQLTLNAPPGTYVFYCAIPGHRQAGMQGTLTVQ